MCNQAIIIIIIIAFCSLAKLAVVESETEPAIFSQACSFHNPDSRVDYLSGLWGHGCYWADTFKNQVSDDGSGKTRSNPELRAFIWTDNADDDLQGGGFCTNYLHNFHSCSSVSQVVFHKSIISSMLLLHFMF